MSSSRGFPRRKALADATAGVVGSLVSMLCFYPVDVWKTSLQAAAGQASTTDADESAQKQQFHHLLSKLSSIQITDLFRGLHHKVAHTIVSSFTYFYVYSLVNTKYLAYRRGNVSSSTYSETYKTSTIAKLLLTAFSAMINTAITLPFDTISSRIQAGPGLSDREKEKNQSIVKGDNKLNGNINQTREEERLYIKKYSLNTNLPKEAFESRITTTDNIDGEKRNQQLRSILSLWNGILPAILLCTNPAIQYTMFENLKKSALQHRPSLQQQQRSKRLTMWEAFIFGLISKFFATVMTYPLIRAKVMLMVASPDVFEDDVCKDDSHRQVGRNGSNGNANSNDERRTKKYPRSLPLLLISIFRNDGMRGIYHGCSVQLLHTIMKSALMLMIRERITSVCHHFFLKDAA